jgi:iron complex transport system ATP-binding protein
VTAALEIRNARVRLGGREVLRGADFTVAHGEFVGLVGPNGAGKTTLLRSLAGLQAAETAAHRLNGADFGILSPRSRAAALAYLPQQAGAAWPLRVERLVALGRLPHLDPWRRPGPEDAAAIARALAATGCTALAARPVNELSGGERARVMLARALATEPEILLADEPVSGLDPHHRLQVIELLRDRADAGHAVVAVLHDLSLAARYCDRVTVIADGRVAADGPPAAMLTPGLMRSVFRVEALIETRAEGLLVLPWAQLDATDD